MKCLLIVLVAFSFGIGTTFGQSVPGGHQPFLNLSARVMISPENPQVIVGFSIPRHDTNGNLVKVVIMRAIGPGLAQFGVPNPLADPYVRIIDASGNDRTPNYDFTEATNRDGTIETSEDRAIIAEDVAEAAAHVGAFPVPVPTVGTPVVSDYSMVGGYGQGTYTMIVSSKSGGTGEVLVELYAVSL